MWLARLVVASLLAVAVAQQDVDAAVDSFLKDDWRTTTEGGKTTSPGNVINETERAWLVEQEKVLVSLWEVAHRHDNSTTQPNALYQAVMHNSMLTARRFALLAASVRARASQSEEGKKLAPSAFLSLKLEREVTFKGTCTRFSIAGEVIFGTLLVVFIVIAIVMIRFRMVAEKFWVALLIMSIVASAAKLVFSSLGRISLGIDSPLDTAVLVCDLFYRAIVAAIVTFYAVILCSALFSASFPERENLPRIVVVSPFVVLACAVIYGVIAVIYPVVSGVFALNLSNLVLFALTATFALVLVVFCAIAAVKTRVLQSALVLAASLLLFSLWLTTLVFLGLYTFVSMESFVVPFVSSLMTAEAVTLIEVAIFLLVSLWSARRKTPLNERSRKSVAGGYEELSQEQQVPLRYAE